MPDKKPAPEVPDHVIESFARCIYPAILAYFESNVGQREFAEWRKQQNKIQVAKEAAEPK